MKIHNLLTMALITICLAGVPVFADSHGKFPGRGSIEAFSRSCDFGNQARQYSKNKDYERAVELDKKAISIYPFDSAWHNNLGNDLRHVGRLEEACKAELQAIDLEPNYAGAWVGLGMCYEKMRKLADAERCYRKGADLDPADYQAVVDVGDILRQQGKFCEARQWLLKAKSCPDSAKFPGEVDKMLSLCEQRKEASD